MWSNPVKLAKINYHPHFILNGLFHLDLQPLRAFNQSFHHSLSSVSLTWSLAKVDLMRERVKTKVENVQAGQVRRTHFHKTFGDRGTEVTAGVTWLEETDLANTSSLTSTWLCAELNAMLQCSQCVLQELLSSVRCVSPFSCLWIDVSCASHSCDFSSKYCKLWGRQWDRVTEWTG